MHHAATRLCRSIAMAPVEGRFEVVLTTNSGYPLDQNLYQSVKGGLPASMWVLVGDPTA
jgi:nickel-dependent lactate racemase